MSMGTHALVSVSCSDRSRVLGYDWPAKVHSVTNLLAPLTTVKWTFVGSDQGWGNTGHSFVCLDLFDKTNSSVLCKYKIILRHGKVEKQQRFSPSDEIVRRSCAGLQLRVVVVSAPWPGWMCRLYSSSLNLNYNGNIEASIAFAKALVDAQDGPWHRSKLMVIGQGRAGKTATVRSLLGEDFDPNLDSTIGASLKQTVTGNKNKSWDIMEDSTDYTTEVVSKVALGNLQETEPLLKDNVRSNKNANHKRIILKARAKAKQKLEEYNEKNQDYESILESFGSNDNELQRINRFANTFTVNGGSDGQSDKKPGNKSISFTIWDYGGQSVFYTLHHLFLTQYGVYLLVFDLREIINNRVTATGYLEFWIKSLRLHALNSPVLLVGTFYDKIKKEKDLEIVKSVVHELMNGFPGFVKSGALGFFPLNNKTKEGIESIRSAIEKNAWKQDYVTKPIPIRWMRALDKMLEDTECMYMPLSDFQAIAKDTGSGSHEEREHMLRLFHELGVIFYMNSTRELSEVITLNPQWLVENISKVIRDRDIHPFNQTEIKQLKSIALETDVQLLFDKALVSEDLLLFLWGNEKFQFFLDFMRQTMLLSDWRFGVGKNASSVKYYLIPSMLGKSKEDNFLCPYDCAVALFEFPIGLPIGVFERLVCVLISNDSLNVNGEPILSCDSLAVSFLHDPGTSETEGPDLKLYQEASDRLVLYARAAHASKYLNIINAMLFKIKAELLGEMFAYSVQVEKYNPVENGMKVENSKRQLNEIDLIDYESAESEEQCTIWFTHQLAGINTQNLDMFLSDI